MKKLIALVGLGAVAYILYKYGKKQEPIVQATPTRTPAEIKKAELKKEGAKLIEPYYESEAGRLAEKRFKASISANKEVLFSGQKQYVTLENLIPDRYGMYNNFYGNYNRVNSEDTTNIDSAIATQKLYIRPKPFFNNTL
jgi:hypothetical protein